MRLIDADYLKEVISNNSLIDFTDDDLFEIIDNAPTVELTKPQSYAMGFCDGLKAQTYEKPPVFERSQGNIRWTDKLAVTSSGDIIDFYGRVVGHINLEDMKEGVV